jgi:hypothetical protein
MAILKVVLDSAFYFFQYLKTKIEFFGDTRVFCSVAVFFFLKRVYLSSRIAGAGGKMCEWCIARDESRLLLRYWVRRQTLARVLVCSAMQLGLRRSDGSSGSWNGAKHNYTTQILRAPRSPAADARTI